MSGKFEKILVYVLNFDSLVRPHGRKNGVMVDPGCGHIKGHLCAVPSFVLLSDSAHTSLENLQLCF